MSNRIVLGLHWIVCVIIAIAYGMEGDAAAMSAYVAASLVISSLGLGMSR